jgi:DNA gyrase/topoisomerase IV subunit A
MQTREEDFVTKLFVASTHAPILFFSSRGMAYKMKVWRLPLGGPQARGKALVNLLPLAEGERITSIMPLPEDEAKWQTLDVMFATARGTVRRNKLSDFTEINRNGKIAMKLDEGDSIIGVATCLEIDDAAHHKGRPMHPLLRHRGAGVCRAQLGRRARHRPPRGRRRHLDVRVTWMPIPRQAPI